ncbi:non-hydrolyzing UDP-N-acetylglucosamine 2-epimerase [Pseudoroseomonas globiformis]|uniref:Non-hydrolyzing UDP-N-acetylglucosamine 2-epimerase n=1 Tax=Teichococcus globiformis TaxID=2307229 RepID=A0ABV7G4Q5_9PROT
MPLPEIHLVAAARPNLPKLAALWHALAAGQPFFCRPVLLHTGQHQDPAMFAAHLADLALPEPEIGLGVAAGGGHAALTGRTMMACAEVWSARRPALVVVAGDVDGTLAAALAARKLGIPVAHLEAGLRCNDRDMPEEINRRAVDAVSDLLWAPDHGTAERLLQEGHDAHAVRAVGNAMIDTLLARLPVALSEDLPHGLAAHVTPGGYGVVTLHRPANVDDRAPLATLLSSLTRVTAQLPLVWPMHPRTAQRLREFRLDLPSGIHVLPPLGYLDFAGLLARASLVATDSGGVQEEAAVLDIPCLTLRPSTERPVTLESGANRLVAPSCLPQAVAEVLAGAWPPARPIPLWDGMAGARMAEHLREVMGGAPARSPGGFAAVAPGNLIEAARDAARYATALVGAHGRAKPSRASGGGTTRVLEPAGADPERQGAAR